MIDWKCLQAMIDELRHADPIFLPSKFWDDLCRKNIKMIETHGLQNFKRSVSQNYYNWMVTSPLDPQFRNAVKLWLRSPSIAPFVTRCTPFDFWTSESITSPLRLTAYQRFFYYFFVCSIWQWTLANSLHSPMDCQIAEPLLGSPFPLYYDRQLISQDLANSLNEHSQIFSRECFQSRANIKMAELGAGYGRLAYVALSMGNKYCVIDIPPALYISQWYLTTIFPEKKSFRFRHFNSYDSIHDEFESADIWFITPNQLELLPEQFFESFITISTLPEMTQEQTRIYLSLMSRSTSEQIYIKQWSNWKNNLDDVSVPTDGYKLDSNWNKSSSFKDVIQPNFNVAIWKRRSASF